ncbi:MAG: SWIM zinc finger family protein, partial [Planctomycetaceae bacterium]
FNLHYGRKPTIEIEPWGIVIEESQHTYDGAFAGEIRVWGRRRLFPLERLLPFAEDVEVRLLGSGMPSFWSVTLQRHRFDLGLSGWTSNDWARQAQFDLMSAKQSIDGSLLQQAREALEQKLVLNPKELADELALSRELAAATLQALCQQGEAMYDFRRLAYRWRRLLAPDQQQKASQGDECFQNAAAVIQNNGVQQIGKPEKSPRGTVRYCCEVTINKTFQPTFEIDDDDRIASASCNCGFFRRNKLRQGPCPHLMAAVIYVRQSQQGNSPFSGDNR